MIDLIFGIILVMLVVTAALALFSEKLLNSVVILSLFSSLLVILLIILQAPDLALAEAVIAAGIMTSFFIITINKTEEIE